MNEGPTLIKASTKAWSIETYITYRSKQARKGFRPPSAM